MTALISIVNDVQEVVRTAGSDKQTLFLQFFYFQVDIVFKQKLKVSASLECLTSIHKASPRKETVLSCNTFF